MTDKKAARFRVGNDAVFTRVQTPTARVAPTPEQFPSDEIPFESPAARGASEREHRTDAELLEDPEVEFDAELGFVTTPKRTFMRAIPPPRQPGSWCCARPVSARRGRSILPRLACRP